MPRALPPINLPAIAFPALALSSGDSVELLDGPADVQRLARGTRVAVLNGFWDRLTLWDAGGLAWRVHGEADPPIGPLGKLLARTVYDPVTPVRVTFDPPRPYELEELKEQLRELVRRDDDVLTQDVSHARLTRMIDLADSYERLLGLLKKSGVV